MTLMIALAAAAALTSARLAPDAEAGEVRCSTAPTLSVEVDVRANGDDGLTQRLRDAIRAAYGACGSGYAVMAPGRSGRLTVTLLENVRWKQVGSRTRVAYRVGYTVYGGPSGGKSGACWEDRLQDCARSIVRGSPFVNME